MSAVRIVARLRPPLPGEVCDDGVRVVSHRKVDKENAEPNKSANNSGPGIIVTKEGSSQHYPFHSAYGPDDSTTQTLFTHDMLPLVDQVFSGRTVTVFAYGVTSSGKTYTMQGNGLDDRGVIGLVVDEIFKRLGAAGGTLSMSYLELYLDAPYDLLVPPSSRRKLQILSTSSAGTTSSHSSAPPLSFGTSIHLPALSTHHIESPEAFRSLYAQAAGNRSTGATLLNSSSSRSHAVLTLYLTLANAVVGKLHLLDLAGSENNNLTGNNPSRMKESSAINTSLTALGLVVSALNDNAKAISKAASKGEDPKLKLIPYRSSSLTRLLSDALGGSSLALLIVCLAPGTKFRSDLVRSVGFASQARRIENKAPPQVKVPTSKTFNFSVPFRSQSSASSSSSLGVDFPSSSTTTDKTLFSSSTSLNKIEPKLGVKLEPGDSSHSPKRPRHLATTSREARPRTSPSKRTRARRASLIPVPAPAANRSGRMSMSMAPEQRQMSFGGAGPGLGVGAGFVMTEEQMQERISKMVQDEVERRLVEIREEERGRGLGLVKEEEKQEQGVQEQQDKLKDKLKAKQEALVPDLNVESNSLPHSHNSSPSSPSEAVESSAQNSNPNLALPPRKRARLLTFKKVMKVKVAEVKEEEEEADESDLSRASTGVDSLVVGSDEQVRDARRDNQDKQEYKQVRVDADDEEIDFLTDPEWEDGNNGEDVTRISGTHQESDRVKTEVEAPREVEEEEILSKPEQVIHGMDLAVVPEGPPDDWQDPEQEEVDQLIDDADMDVDLGMGAGIETTTSISASSSTSTSLSRISRTASASTPPANSQSPAPAPIAMRSSTSTADARPAARRSSTSGSTSAAKSTSSDASATTSKPKRARNVNAKSQELATKRQLIGSETASTPTRSSSPASAASSSSASADDKQTARAWLLQAKRAQDRNELPQALAFYQRAVSFVPALNGQLKDRIISIEHAIATNTALPPSPKRTTETPSGFKVPKVKRHGGKSNFASSWLSSKSSSAGSAYTGSASGVETASLTTQDPDKLSKKSSNKRKLPLDDDEVAEEGHSNQELELQEIITKKRKDDKGKGKAPAVFSHSVSEAGQDQLDQLEPEDEGQWEVPASVCANLDRMESNETSGSGSSSLSSSGVPRSEPFSPLVPAIASPQAIVLSAIETPPSPPSITTVSVPAPPVFVEHDTDLDDQMEVDEVAGALGEFDRGSSVEPSQKEINTKRATRSHTRSQSSQSIRKLGAGSGLTNIKEEEEAEPDLSVAVEIDGDDGSEWEESPQKKKSQTRSKKALTRKTTVKSKSEATKSGKSKSTRKSRQSAVSAINPNDIPGGPLEQEEPDAGESQSIKRMRYVYGSSDEEEVFVRDAVPVKKKRLNVATRRKVSS